MSSRLSGRLERLEGRHGGRPSPAMVEQVATRLDRLGAVDPETANALLISFGLVPCYPSVPSVPSEEIQ